MSCLRDKITILWPEVPELHTTWTGEEKKENGWQSWMFYSNVYKNELLPFACKYIRCSHIQGLCIPLRQVISKRIPKESTPKDITDTWFTCRLFRGSLKGQGQDLLRALDTLSCLTYLKNFSSFRTILPSTHQILSTKISVKSCYHLKWLWVLRWWWTTWIYPYLGMQEEFLNEIMSMSHAIQPLVKTKFYLIG